jgi:hypothetical protein
MEAFNPLTRCTFTILPLSRAPGRGMLGQEGGELVSRWEVEKFAPRFPGFQLWRIAKQ